MSLREKQELFARLTVKLYEFILTHGFTFTYGEAFRTHEQAVLDAQHGTGIVNSLHTIRLAIDLNIFRDGIWLTDGNDFKFIGEFWEALNPLNRWGQRFSKPDGNHFSLEHNGVK